VVIEQFLEASEFFLSFVPALTFHGSPGCAPAGSSIASSPTF
jgi:hypothetical protein